jgi:hypothetical protein
MNNELDYYLAFPVMTPGTPTVIVSPDWDCDQDINLIETEIQLDDFGPIPIEFEFDEPYPKKPVIVDSFTNCGFGVISEKLYAILEPLKINGLQLISATVADPRNHTVYDGYYFPHIFNHIECLDMNASVYSTSVLGTIRSIKKMVLDTKILSKIPLENRLILRLGESFPFALFHGSVVEKMMAVNPTGIRFVKVEDYHIGSAFD